LRPGHGPRPASLQSDQSTTALCSRLRGACVKGVAPEGRPASRGCLVLINGKGRRLVGPQPIAIGATGACKDRSVPFDAITPGISAPSGRGPGYSGTQKNRTFRRVPMCRGCLTWARARLGRQWGLIKETAPSRRGQAGAPRGPSAKGRGVKAAPGCASMC